MVTETPGVGFAVTAVCRLDVTSAAKVADADGAAPGSPVPLALTAASMIYEAAAAAAASQKNIPYSILSQPPQVTFTEFIVTVLASTPSVPAIALRKLLPNVESAARVSN